MRGIFNNPAPYAGIGSMAIENALTMEQVEEHQVLGTLPEQYLSPRSALQGVEHIELSERSQIERFGHGNAVDLGSRNVCW